MKCFVCGRNVEEGSAFCPGCGYPIIVPIGGMTPEAEAQMKNSAEEYRSRICREIEIGFYAYSHRIEKDARGNEVIRPARRDEIPLGICGDLRNNEIKWYPEQFVRPKSGNLEYWIYVKRGSETIGPERKSIRLNSGSGDIQIGLLSESMGRIRFCVGTQADYAVSDLMDVLTV